MPPVSAHGKPSWVNVDHFLCVLHLGLLKERGEGMGRRQEGENQINEHLILGGRDRLSTPKNCGLACDNVEWRSEIGGKF